MSQFNPQYRSLGSGEPASEKTVAELRRLLGKDVVLLPVAFGAKKPLLKDWQKTDASVMSDKDYVAGLVGHNVGVLLGVASGGLVSFDFDDKEHGQMFFDANPWLEKTLTTKANRGWNFWVRLVGDFPKSFDIKNREGTKVGEFRGDGRQTVIHGRHPNGRKYRPVGDARVAISCEWSDVKWADGLGERPVGADPVYQELVAEHGEPVHISERGAVTLNPPFFVGKFLLEHPVLFCPGRGFYEYAADTGLWSRITLDRAKVMFARDLGEYGKLAGLPKISLKRTEPTLRGLVELLKGYGEKDIGASRPANVLHFQNGMLHFDRSPPKLRPFSPDYWSVNATPFRYDPDARCPGFTGIFKAAVGSADLQLILDWLGMALTGHNFGQKILLLTGVGGAGKGLLTTIITALVGKANCEQLRTGQLTTRFELSRFIDKTLLVGTDVPGDFLNRAGAQMLKALTGGDLLSVESKNLNGGAQILGDLNVVITSNQRLRLRLDGDHQAWRRRLLIIDFQKVVDFVNPQLAKEIIEAEACGIINAALAGLGRVRCSFREEGSFPMEDSQRLRVEELIDESDSLRSFLRAEVTQNPKGDVTTDELQRGYHNYCAERGWIDQPDVVFRNQVPQLMHEFFRAAKSHDIERNGSARRGYSGVAMKGDVWG